MALDCDRLGHDTDSECNSRQGQEGQKFKEAPLTMPLLTSLPTPVLAVTPDAVRQLEGRDALYGLWGVFSKCKESIQNGRRLENISWRLWYREMMSETVVRQGGEHAVVYDDEKFGLFEEKVNYKKEEESTYRPPTPLELHQHQQQPQLPPHRPELDKQHLAGQGHVPLPYDQGLKDRRQQQSPASYQGGQQQRGMSEVASPSIDPAHSSSSLSSGTISQSIPPSHYSSSTLASMSSSTNSGASSRQQERRASFLAGSKPMNVGKIICDLIPGDGEEGLGLSALSISRSPRGLRSALFFPIGFSASLEESTPQAASSSLASPRGPSSFSKSATAATPTASMSAAGVIGRPASVLTIPAAKFSPASVGRTASVSQLPTPGAEMDEDDGIPFSGLSSNQASSIMPTNTMLPTGAPPSPSLTESSVNTHGYPDPEREVLSLSSNSSLVSNAEKTDPEAVATSTTVGHVSDSPHYVGAAPDAARPSNSIPTILPVSTTITASASAPGTATISIQNIDETDPSCPTVTTTPTSPRTPPTTGPVPPTLVIVNPTPGPTPQPTPPDTPLLGGRVPAAVADHLQRKGQQYLGPPSPTPRLRGTANARKLNVTDDQQGAVESEQDSVVLVPKLGLGPPATRASEMKIMNDATTIAYVNSDTQMDVRGKSVSAPLIPTSMSTVGGQEQRERESDQGHKPATSVTSVTSVTSAGSAKSAKSTVSLPSTRPGAGPTRRASSGSTAAVVATAANRSRSKGSRVGGGNKSKASLGAKSKTNTGVTPAARNSSKSRSRSRGHEDAVGLAAAAVGVMTSTNSDAEAMRRASAGAQSRSTGNLRGLTALTRTLSHEDVLEVSGEEEEAEESDAEEDHAAVVEARVREEEERKWKLLEEERRAQMEQEKLRIEQERRQQQEQEKRRLAQIEAAEKEKQRRLYEYEEELKQQQLLLQQQMEQEKRSILHPNAQHQQQQRQSRAKQGGLSAAHAKKSKFNIGSNSDDGSVSNVASKSGGSGEGSVGVSESGYEAGVANGAPAKPNVDLQVGQRDGETQRPLPAHVLHQGNLQRVKRPTLDQQQLTAALQAEAERAEQQALLREKQRVQEQNQEKAKVKGKAKEKETEAAAFTSLASPLLPQGTKRTIVLATSESEYTDTDEDEDSWTSEEENSQQYRKAPSHQGQQSNNAHQRRHSHAESSHRSHVSAGEQRNHPGYNRLQRTHSHAAGGRPLTKREIQRQANLVVERAAQQLEEENRKQKEMFTKKPTSSFQNLTRLGAMTSINGDGNGEVQRTKSVGLLTQLMNPDPAMFPEGHPYRTYRRGYSSGELNRTSGAPGGSGFGFGGLGGFAPLTSIQPDDGGKRPQPQPMQMTEAAPRVEMPQPAKVVKAEVQPQQQPAPGLTDLNQPALQRSSTEPPAPARHHQRQTSQGSQTSQQQRPRPQRQQSQPQPGQQTSTMASALSRGLRAFGLQMSLNKSSVALPVASQVQAGSMNPNGFAAPERSPPPPPVANANLGPSGRTNAPNGGGYRPRGPPQGQELDTDSDTDGDDKGNNLMMSNSVAQERLLKFAHQKGITRNRVASGQGQQMGEDDVPPWARESQLRPHEIQNSNHVNNVQAALPTATPTPIPLAHPYNLPAPAAPTTPRTTRRLMLRNEMPESLRRHLLWERQQAIVPIRRTASSTATSSGYSGNGPNKLNALSNLQPLTSTPSMVQLHAKGSGAGDDARRRGDVRGSGDRERRSSGDDGPRRRAPPEEIEERRKRALARNRSWANNYHTSGW